MKGGLSDIEKRRRRPSARGLEPGAVRACVRADVRAGACTHVVVASRRGGGAGAHLVWWTCCVLARRVSYCPVRFWP